MSLSNLFSRVKSIFSYIFSNFDSRSTLHSPSVTSQTSCRLLIPKTWIWSYERKKMIKKQYFNCLSVKKTPRLQSLQNLASSIYYMQQSTVQKCWIFEASNGGLYLMITLVHRCSWSSFPFYHHLTMNKLSCITLQLVVVVYYHWRLCVPALLTSSCMCRQLWKWWATQSSVD